MVRGNGRDRIQVYARIVHQLTSERMKPILEHCVWGPPTRQQKEPFNAILTRPGSYKSTFWAGQGSQISACVCNSREKQNQLAPAMVWAGLPPL